jgi:hypothetical protein
LNVTFAGMAERLASRVFFCIGVITHHIEAMAKEHPHSGAVYRVVPQEDLTYAVEVIVPGSYPAMVTSFATEQTAEAWIADHKRRVAENVPRNFMRGRSVRT